jgi:hypothetical protein
MCFLHLSMDDHHFAWKQKLLKKHRYLLHIVTISKRFSWKKGIFFIDICQNWQIVENQTPLGYYNKYTIQKVYFA